MPWLPRTLHGGNTCFQDRSKHASSPSMRPWPFVIGLIYSCCMIYILLEAEAQLMTSAMESMLTETIDDDLSYGAPPRLDPFSRLYIEHDTKYEIPERFRNLPEGYSEYTDGEDLHVFVKTINGKKYIMTRSQDEFENWERHLFFTGLALLSAIVLISLALGLWMAQTILPPAGQTAGRNTTAQSGPQGRTTRCGIVFRTMGTKRNRGAGRKFPNHHCTAPAAFAK